MVCVRHQIQLGLLLGFMLVGLFAFDWAENYSYNSITGAQVGGEDIRLLIKLDPNNRIGIDASGGLVWKDNVPRISLKSDGTETVDFTVTAVNVGAVESAEFDIKFDNTLFTVNESVEFASASHENRQILMGIGEKIPDLGNESRRVMEHNISVGRLSPGETQVFEIKDVPLKELLMEGNQVTWNVFTVQVKNYNHPSLRPFAQNLSYITRYHTQQERYDILSENYVSTLLYRDNTQGRYNSYDKPTWISKGLTLVSAPVLLGAIGCNSYDSNGRAPTILYWTGDEWLKDHETINHYYNSLSFAKDAESYGVWVWLDPSYDVGYYNCFAEAVFSEIDNDVNELRFLNGQEWNFFTISPKMADHSFREVSGTCSVENTFILSYSEGVNKDDWTWLQTDFVFSDQTLGYGLWVWVPEDCQMGTDFVR